MKKSSLSTQLSAQLSSFRVAFAGIDWNLRHEGHMIFHVVAIFTVIAAGLFFRLSSNEWLTLIIFFALVPSLELVNSAVECTCDIVRDKLKLDYQATRLPRDLAAGAVLWASLAAVIAALIIFGPRLWQLGANIS